MKIIVTGSAGFIGRYTVGLLESKGHDVLGIDRNGTESGIRGDVTDWKFLRMHFEDFQPEAVLHLAANSSLQRSVTDALYDAHNNVIGTVTMISMAQHYKVKRFVFASTSAVYGPQKSGIYNEDDPVRPQVPYGVSKAAGEMYVRCSGIPYAILRYGNVYGPGQKPLGENILIARALAHMIDAEPFKINGAGDKVRDWVYVEDVADANINALFSPVSGTFNIATGKGVGVNEIVDKLKRLIGYKRKIEHGPENKGELRSVIMDSQLADELLNWKAKTRLVDGLAQTYRTWTS